MLDVITTEMLLTGGVLGMSAVAAAGGLVMLRTHREKPKDVDIDALVRNAPYHRLHNIVKIQSA